MASNKRPHLYIDDLVRGVKLDRSCWQSSADNIM